MRKTHTRVMALLGALALTAFGMTGCSHGSGGGGGSDSWSNGITANREAVSAPAAAGIVTVSGAAMYSGNSIVDAFAAFANVSSGDITVTLTPGTYDVPFGKGLYYKGGANIKIKGTGTAEYGLDVLIKGRGKDQLTNKTRPVLEVEGSGSLVLENVTIRNTTKRSEVTETSSSGSALTQAEALGFDSSGTVAAYNCSFLSHQDTVRTISKSWFYNCYIEGDVDFIWMEAGSIVGLYEECKIYIAGDDEKSECYVLAPRIDLTSKVGKGNVIYKSRIIVGDGVTKAYLFRNPWSKNPNTLYNQGAVVDTEISGTLHSDLAKYDAWGHDAHDPQHLGWKVDSAIAGAYPSRLSSIGTVDATTKASEYGGREAILNRMYNLSEKSYAQDNSSYWDIAAVISKNGWSVTSDSSQSKQDGDSSKTSVTYTFTEGANGWTDSLVDAGGFSIDTSNKKYAHAGSAGASMSFWVVGTCDITLTYFYQGWGTINGEEFGKDGTNVSGTKKITVNGAASGTKVTITTEGQTYITSIDIQYTTNVDAALEALKAKLAANTTYNFKALNGYSSGEYPSSVSATSGTGGTATLSGFKYDSPNYGLQSGTTNATISVPVSGNCTIKVYVSYGQSSISCAGSSKQNPNNGGNDHKNAPEEVSFAYTGGSGTAVITVANGSTYISQVSVIYVE